MEACVLKCKMRRQKVKCRLKNMPTPQQRRRQKKAPVLRCCGPCSLPPNSADALPSHVLVYPQRTECRYTQALSPCEVCVSTLLALTFTFPQHPCILSSNSSLHYLAHSHLSFLPYTLSPVFRNSSNFHLLSPLMRNLHSPLRLPRPRRALSYLNLLLVFLFYN